MISYINSNSVCVFSAVLSDSHTNSFQILHYPENSHAWLFRYISLGSCLDCIYVLYHFSTIHKMFLNDLDYLLIKIKNNNKIKHIENLLYP